MNDFEQNSQPDMDWASRAASGDLDAVQPASPVVKPYTRRAAEGERPNVQISLRVPAGWVYQLRRRAIDASEKEVRMITPQEIVRRIVADALNRKP